MPQGNIGVVATTDKSPPTKAASMKPEMSLKHEEPSDPIQVSDASMRHHLKYIGCASGFKHEDGTPRVPTPEEVVERGWEATSYLEQFKTA